MSAKLLKVLFVEDSEYDGEIVAHKLVDVATVKVVSGRADFEAALKENFDVALVDLQLIGFSGQEAMGKIKSECPDLPVIIVTGSVDSGEADMACEYGASRFFLKQDLNGLERAVKGAYETRLLKAQAIRDNRMEIIGTLSAGMAHDTNNIWAVHVMGIEHLRARINPVDERILDAMMSATKRGAEMTNQILTFARGTNGTMFKNVTAEYLFGEIGQLIRSTFPANIRLAVTIVPGTSKIRGDPTQLVQVLANLVTNARDAMTPNGGDLEIQAQNASGVLSGPSVCLSVRDTGGGIAEEALLHIWEPFWTSKPVGHGTGLGLPMVKRIIETHHGIVDVKTGSGGTKFFVYVPIGIPWKSDDDIQPIGHFDGNRKCVLIVDDQPSVRDLTQLLLERANYKVMAAQNGPEALSFFRSDNQIDALITDECMPMLSGSELVRNLRSVGLDLPIILLSGFDSAGLKEPAANVVLQKPVSREKLLGTLQELLKDAPA